MIEREWLNEEGQFLFGPHKGELVSVVAECDPDYVEYVLENEDITSVDAKVLLVSLNGKAH